MFTRPFYHDYSPIEADLPALLEIARIALQDGDVFDLAAEVMDIGDTEMLRIRDNLVSFLEAEPPAGSTGSPLARALAAVSPGFGASPYWNQEAPGAADKESCGLRAGDIAYRFARYEGRSESLANQAYLAARQAVYQEG